MLQNLVFLFSFYFYIYQMYQISSNFKGAVVLWCRFINQVHQFYLEYTHTIPFSIPYWFIHLPVSFIIHHLHKMYIHHSWSLQGLYTALYNYNNKDLIFYQVSHIQLNYHLYTYIHIHIHTYIHIHTHIYIHISTYMHTYTHR